jgi:hypothetical protein
MNFEKMVTISSCAVATTLMMISTAASGAATIVPPGARESVHNTSALILLAQREVLVGDDESVGSWSNVTTTPGAQLGIVGALINSSKESKKEKIQNALVAPIRSGLSGVDVDALAMKATSLALQKVAWLNLTPIGAAQDDSVKAESLFLDGVKGDQSVFVHYVYFFDPEFAALHTKILIELARKSVPAGGTPEDRFKRKNLVYRQTIDISVLLPDARKGSEAVNASAWAENNGELARKALQSAFDAAAIYISKTIDMTPEGLSVMYDRKLPKVKYDGDWGQKIEEGNGRTALWAERFVIISRIE